MRTQSVARREEAGSPREAAVSFREPLASGQAASSASSGGPGSPATKAEAEVSHEVNAALGGTGPSSEDERASRETEVKTAQGESGPSQAPTAASSLTPAEGQEESAVSSALPGMTLEETSRPLSVHPLVSIAQKGSGVSRTVEREAPPPFCLLALKYNHILCTL